MAYAMTQTQTKRRDRHPLPIPADVAVVRTSLITQLHPVLNGDRAVHDLLHLLAQTVADFAAMPEIHFTPTGSQSALAIVSAIWPERLTVKLTALATPVPQTADTSLVIISAKITCESAPRARELADALLDTIPSTIVTRITALSAPLTPLPNLNSGGEPGMTPMQTVGQTDDRAGESRLAIGWRVIQ